MRHLFEKFLRAQFLLASVLLYSVLALSTENGLPLTQLDDAYKAVQDRLVFIEIPRNDNMTELCHGFILDKNHILTDAHCLVITPDANLTGNKKSSFYQKGNVYLQNGKRFTFKESIVFGKFVNRSTGQLQADNSVYNQNGMYPKVVRATNDYAIIKTDQAMPVPKSEVIFANVEIEALMREQQPIVIISHETKDAMAWRYGKPLPAQKYTQGAYLKNLSGEEIIFFNNSAETKTGSSDCGSPILTIVNGKTVIIGFYSGKKTFSETNINGYGSKVSIAKDWISETMALNQLRN